MFFSIEHLSAAEIWKHLVENKDVMQYSDDFRKNYSEKLSDKAVFCTARNENNNLIGVIAFYCNYPPSAFISHACIDVNYRGKKLIGKMLCQVQEYAASKNFKSLKIEVLQNNIFAIRAYENFGFSCVEKKDSRFLMEKII